MILGNTLDLPVAITVLDSTMWYQELIFGILLLISLAIYFKAYQYRSTYIHYRFAAFGLLSALIAFNSPYWFTTPFSITQIFSWLFLLLSLIVACVAAIQLRSMGKASRHIIEGTKELVQKGLYRYIRHPMYGSLILLDIGVMLKSIEVLSVSLAVVVAILLYLTARTEEQVNLDQFGSSYEEYITRTMYFIPYIL